MDFCLIFVLFFATAFVVCIATLIISTMVENYRKKKWQNALTNDRHLRAMLATVDKLYKEYTANGEITANYKMQVDILLRNIHYCPSYVRENREAQAEEYKKLLFLAHIDECASYDAYCSANRTVDDYCKTHKLKRYYE